MQPGVGNFYCEEIRKLTSLVKCYSAVTKRLHNKAAPWITCLHRGHAKLAGRQVLHSDVNKIQGGKKRLEYKRGVSAISGAVVSVGENNYLRLGLYMTH